MRSTIHAVCCGTNRTMVFVGVRLCDEKYAGGPPDCAFPKLEKTLVGFVAACELSCVKLRAEHVVKTAASGDILEVASGRELRSSVEAVVAASRVRDAIVRVGDGVDDGHAKLWELVGDICTHLRRDFRLHSDILAPAPNRESFQPASRTTEESANLFIFTKV
jgi:hypothetical protein